MKEKYDRLDQILNHQELITFIGGTLKERYIECIDLIKKHIENDGENISDEESDKIKNSIFTTISLLIEKEAKKNIERWFIEAYTELVYNWNENFIHDNEINSHINLALNFTNECMTLDQTLQIQRRVLGRLERMAKSDLPSFKISQHYWDIIQDEDE